MILNIIIPRHNREKNWKRLKKNLPVDPYRFHITTHDGIKDGVFNTGYAQNEMVQQSPYQWFLKNDVDCIADSILYEHAYKKIQHIDPTTFLVFGAVHEGAIGMRKHFICGNEYLFSKHMWKRVGGVPEWDGWGFEDYAFIYHMVKMRHPSIYLKNYNRENVADRIRDDIIMPMNYSVPYHFLHLNHEKDNNYDNVDINRDKLYNIVRQYEN